MTRTRHIFPLMFMAGIIGAQLRAQSQPLAVERQDDHLVVSAPELHFLAGKPLEQLHDGASVTYVLALTFTAEPGHAPILRMQRRFIVSFDLWEEQFSVVEADPPGSSASHLSARKTEAWCLENMAVPLRALPAEKTFVIKLECWKAENGEESRAESGSPLTLARLIDALSRKGHPPPAHWEALSRPLRLADLQPKAIRETPGMRGRSPG